MANKIATIGFLKQKVAGTPITIISSQGDTYCPTYTELLNGSIIPKIHITIPRYSVGDGKGIYSSNQLVCEIDIDLIFYGKLTVKTNYDGIVTAYTATQTATTETQDKNAVFTNTFIIGEDVTVVVPCPPDEAPKYTYVGLTPKPDYLSWGSGDTSTQTISVSGIKNGSEYSTYTKGTGYTVMTDNTVITVNHNETVHPATSEVTYPSLSTGITSSYNFKMTLKSAATNTYNVIPPANPSDVDQTAFLNFYSNDLNYYDAAAEAVKENSGKTYNVTILSNSGGTTTVNVDGNPTTYEFGGSGSNWSVIVPIPEGKHVIINRTQPNNSTSGGTDTYSGLYPTVTDLIYTKTGDTQTIAYNGIITTSAISAITWSAPSSAFTSLDNNKTVNLDLTSAITETVAEKTTTTTPNVSLTQPTSNGFSGNVNKNVVTITSPRTKSDTETKGSFVVTATNYSDSVIYATLTSNEYCTLSFHSNSGGTVTVNADGDVKSYNLNGSGTDWSNEAKILKGASVQISRTIPSNETKGGVTTVEGLTPSSTSLTYNTVSTQQKVIYTGVEKTTATSSVTWSAPSSSFTITNNTYFDMPLASTTKEIVASSSTITYPNVVLNQTASNGFVATATNNIVTITSPNAKKDIETKGSFVVTANGGYRQATIDTTLDANKYYTLTLTSNSGGTAYVGGEIYTFEGSDASYVATGKVLENAVLQVSRTTPLNTTSGGTKTYEGLTPSSTILEFEKESSSATITYNGLEKTTATSAITWTSPSSAITINGNKTFNMPLTSAVTITTPASNVITTPYVTINQSTLNGFTANVNNNVVVIKSPSEKLDYVQEAKFIVSSLNYNQAQIVATLSKSEIVDYVLTVTSNSGGTVYITVDGVQTPYTLVNKTISVPISAGKTATVTRTKPSDSSTAGASTYTGLKPSSSTASFENVSETKSFIYSGSKTTGTVTATTWTADNTSVVMNSDKVVEANLTSATTTTPGTTTNVSSVSVSPSSSNGFTATASGLKVTITAPNEKGASIKTASFTVTQSLDTHIVDATIDASLPGAIDELDCTRSKLILSTTQLTIPTSVSEDMSPTTTYTFPQTGGNLTLYAYFHAYYTVSGWKKWEECNIVD